MFVTFPSMLLVTVALLTSDYSSGLEGDLFLSTYNKHGNTAGVILSGEDLKLVCETNRNASLEIKRVRDGKQLVTAEGRKSVEYYILAVTCEDIGSYECTADRVHKIWRFGVFDCPPQPCETTDVNMTVYLPLHRKVQLYLCVLAYPNISNEVKINNVTFVRKKTLSEWRWDYNKTSFGEGSINKVYINVCRENMTDEDYGTLNIRVYGNSLNWFLDYTIILKPPGPPECPTDVSVEDQGQNYVTLSWRPGLDGGANQSFHVYRSRENMTWDHQSVPSGETSLNITELQANMGYLFRVVASNAFSSAVNESVCENTIFIQTKSPTTKGKLPKDDPIDASTGSPAENVDALGETTPFIVAAACAVIVTLSVLVVVFLCCMKVRQTARNGYSIAGNDASEEFQEMAGVNPSSDQQNSSDAYYISKEGLKYISVVHVPGKKSAKRKRKKEKQEKIVYATLDHTKMGNLHPS